MKVAILIPTLNRKEFLLRTVKYYVSLNSSHPIYIGDASASSIEDEIKNLALGELELYYYHLAQMSDRDTMIFLAQEASSLYRYCSFQGDDDFFVPDSLSLCSEFLHDNSNYRTAQGKGAVLSLDVPGAYGRVNGLVPYLNIPSLSGNTGLERLNEIAETYWPTNFSVHRTKEFIEDFKDNYYVKDRNWGEITNSYSCAINGKSKYLDVLYLIRNVHDGINHESRDTWLSSAHWAESFDATKATLAEKLGKADSIDIARSKYYINKAFLRSQFLSPRAKKREWGWAPMEYLVNYIRKSKLGFWMRTARRSLIGVFLMTPGRDQDVRYMMSRKSKYFDTFIPIKAVLNDTILELEK